MLDTETIIELLGIEGLSEEEQENALDTFHLELGGALMKDMTDVQMLEYERIINGDDSYIFDWLNRNKPGYQNSEEFQVFVEATDHDNDEDVSPEKMYASAAWLDINQPNIESIIVEVAESVRSQLS